MRDHANAAFADPREPGRRTALAAAAAALLATGRAFPARASGGSLRIAGTGSAMSTVRALAEAHHRRDPAAAELRFLPNLGTSGGIAAVLEGAADIALAARPPTDAERAAGVRDTAYARTPLAFATKAGGAAARATAMADVVRIHAGELAEWPDGAPIRVVRRPPSDSAALTLAAASPAMAGALAAAQRRPGLVTAGTDQDNADALEAVHGSFGAITLAQFLSEGRRLALFTLDGVEPTPHAVAEGRYPLSMTFRFVTRAEPAPAAAAFMGFVAGPEGGAVLAGLGQEPVGGGHGGGA
jgi:phosphate transport system substrate-binding protein